MSEAMAPCPPDSAIMKAWKAYGETESFKNSFRYVTVEQRKELLPPSDPTANAVTDWHRDQWAQGSMWAAFMRGWLAAKGPDPLAEAANKPAISQDKIKAIDEFLADGEQDKGYRAFVMMRQIWPQVKEMVIPADVAQTQHALREADIYLSSLLAEVADPVIRKGMRATLDLIDAVRKPTSQVTSKQ